jgi:hypothetical protein
MSGENSSFAEAADVNSGEKGKGRSTISFPYMPLNDAAELAQAIHGNVGLGECGDDQLAAWTNQSIKSSGFRVQIAAARLFGIITSPSAGKYRLTDLGGAIVDPAQSRETRASAFLNVPLYRAVFEKYRGGVLPGQAAAMERELVSLGVSEKVKDRARQVFERSAEQAGFFEQGRNRLVMPGIAPGRDAQRDEEKSRDDFGGSGGSGGSEGLDLDPLLIALLKKIPPADKGWPAANRVRWFRTFAMNVSQIYDAEDSSPVEMKIDFEPTP